MRRCAAIFAILFCFLLTGCGDAQTSLQQALDFRAKLLNGSGCKFSADLRADYGDTVFDFSADCVYDNSIGTLTVTQPETISGISASTGGDGASVSFGGTTLALRSLGEGRVPPLAAVWMFGSAWESDYISAGGSDGETYRITILKGYDEDELQIDTWLESGVPVYGEIAYRGERVISATFHSFSFL